MKKILLIILLVLASNAYTQTITGTLTQATGQNLMLYGYNGLQATELGGTIVETDGSFTLSYNVNYKGMGYLKIGESTLFLVLNESNIVVNGTELADLSSINYENSLENSLFTEYSMLYNTNDAALKAWQYLLPQYQTIKALSTQTNVQATIVKEIERLQNSNHSFLANLEASLYVKWYLPTVQLVNQMLQSVKSNPKRIPGHIADFRKLNFNSKQLYHSGLLANLLERHYIMIEYSGLSLDSMYVQMNTSTDYLIENLNDNDSLLNEVSNFLFDLMEKRSWFTASEHLAISMLTNNSCVLTPKLADQLETYRAMKVGKTAKEIDFTQGILLNNSKELKVKNLAELNNKATLVVFGASWCPKCATELPKIEAYYEDWKAKGVEVLFVSLDHNKPGFLEFTKNFPWLSYCDYNAWESQVAKNYYVFATPTMFLINNTREILVRPNSLEQVDAWINYKLY